MWATAADHALSEVVFAYDLDQSVAGHREAEHDKAVRNERSSKPGWKTTWSPWSLHTETYMPDRGSQRRTNTPKLAVERY
jgi:hypothetical protein